VVTKADSSCPNTPCIVNFDGPSTWETKLNAYADFGAPVAGEKTVTPNVAISLEQNGTPLDSGNFVKTVPYSSLDPAAVEVTIQAKTGTTSKQVILIDSPPLHGPPPGYRITAITISPIAVVISGKALPDITTLSLPAVDLSGKTANFTVTVPIPYPAGVSGSLQNARITYSISANPNIAASPTPSP